MKYEFFSYLVSFVKIAVEWVYAQKDVANKFACVVILPSGKLYFFFLLKLWLNVYKYLEMFF